MQPAQLTAAYSRTLQHFSRKAHGMKNNTKQQREIL